MSASHSDNSDVLNDIIKKFWNNRPCNIRHSNKEIGTREYFEDVTDRKYFVEPHILTFADFDKWSNKKVLEVGCGIGTDAISFLNAGADYYGIDISEESVSLTKRRLEVYGYDSSRITCINAEELTNIFSENTFDLVYAFGTIHHMANKDKVLEEIYTVLKDTGRLKVMLYAKESWKCYMIEAGLDQFEAQAGCPVADVYTEQDVIDLLHNFNVSSITKDHIFIWSIEEYKKYEYVPEKWFKHMDKKMFDILEKKLGFHLLIDATKKQEAFV